MLTIAYCAACAISKIRVNDATVVVLGFFDFMIVLVYVTR